MEDFYWVRMDFSPSKAAFHACEGTADDAYKELAYNFYSSDGESDGRSWQEKEEDDEKVTSALYYIGHVAVVVTVVNCGLIIASVV